MAAAVEVMDLHKHYGGVRAVDGIAFGVAEGEIFGLLGHNGAGKTTTVRLLTGRARPTSGSAAVLGHPLPAERDRVKPLINLVFEEPNLYERLSGRDNLRLFAELYGAPRARADEVLELVGLSDAGGRAAKTYSTGMKQRLLIARALVNRPRVLFLDEPTKGLDPRAFFIAVAVFAVTMIGFGVLLGGLFRTAQQVSTWGTFLLIPVIGPGFAAGVPVPDWAGAPLSVLPSSQAVRLMANGIAGKPLYSDVALGYAVLAAWAILAYGLVAWRLATRED